MFLEEVDTVPFARLDIDSDDVGSRDELFGIWVAQWHELNFALRQDIWSNRTRNPNDFRMHTRLRWFVVECTHYPSNAEVLLYSNHNYSSVHIQKANESLGNLLIEGIVPRISVVFELQC